MKLLAMGDEWVKVGVCNFNWVSLFLEHSSLIDRPVVNYFGQLILEFDCWG